MRDHLRSVPASVFLRLADVPGLTVFSLQHRVRDADLPALLDRPAIDRGVEKAIDMAETAKLIASLDLVVAVDTAVAHLAAAMGKPVWLLLHSTPDWRWQTKRSDSPWYPTMRLFRLKSDEWLAEVAKANQRRRRNDGPDDMGWDPLIRRVRRALLDFRRRWQA